MGECTATGSGPACQQAAHHNFAEANIIGFGPAEDRGGTESAMGQGQGTTSEKGRVKGKYTTKPRSFRMWALLRKRKNMTRTIYNTTIYNTMRGGPLAEIRPVSPLPCTAESGPVP